eukprot:g70941.t1
MSRLTEDVLLISCSSGRGRAGFADLLPKLDKIPFQLDQGCATDRLELSVDCFDVSITRMTGKQRHVLKYNYKGAEEGELTVAKGTVVTVEDVNSTGWSLVQTEQGSAGWVPSTYIKPYTTEPQQPPARRSSKAKQPTPSKTQQPTSGPVAAGPVQAQTQSLAASAAAVASAPATKSAQATPVASSSTSSKPKPPSRNRISSSPASSVPSLSKRPATRSRTHSSPASSSSSISNKPPSRSRTRSSSSSPNSNPNSNPNPNPKPPSRGRTRSSSSSPPSSVQSHSHQTQSSSSPAQPLPLAVRGRAPSASSSPSAAQPSKGVTSQDYVEDKPKRKSVKPPPPRKTSLNAATGATTALQALPAPATATTSQQAEAQHKPSSARQQPAVVPSLLTKPSSARQQPSVVPSPLTKRKAARQVDSDSSDEEEDGMPLPPPPPNLPAPGAHSDSDTDEDEDDHEGAPPPPPPTVSPPPTQRKNIKPGSRGRRGRAASRDEDEGALPPPPPPPPIDLPQHDDSSSDLPESSDSEEEEVKVVKRKRMQDIDKEERGKVADEMLALFKDYDDNMDDSGKGKPFNRANWMEKFLDLDPNEALGGVRSADSSDDEAGEGGVSAPQRSAAARSAIPIAEAQRIEREKRQRLSEKTAAPANLAAEAQAARTEREKRGSIGAGGATTHGNSTRPPPPVITRRPAPQQQPVAQSQQSAQADSPPEGAAGVGSSSTVGDLKTKLLRQSSQLAQTARGVGAIVRSGLTPTGASSPHNGPAFFSAITPRASLTIGGQAGANQAQGLGLDKMVSEAEEDANKLDGQTPRRRGMTREEKESIVNAVHKNQSIKVQKGITDMDLSYVTDRVIAMELPGSQKNTFAGLRDFFNTYHKDHVTVYNLCEERSYTSDVFSPIPVECKFAFGNKTVPPFTQILAFCRHVHDWLQQDPLHVAAIHCAGGARTGLMLCCLLIFTRIASNEAQALRYYSAFRGRAFIKSAIPSQIRYVTYFSDYMDMSSKRQQLLNRNSSGDMVSAPLALGQANEQVLLDKKTFDTVLPMKLVTLKQLSLSPIPPSLLPEGTSIWFELTHQDFSWSSAKPGKKAKVLRDLKHNKLVILLDSQTSADSLPLLFNDFHIVVRYQKRIKVKTLCSFYLNTRFLEEEEDDDYQEALDLMQQIEQKEMLHWDEVDKRMYQENMEIVKQCKQRKGAPEGMSSGKNSDQANIKFSLELTKPKLDVLMLDTVNKRADPRFHLTLTFLEPNVNMMKKNASRKRGSAVGIRNPSRPGA